MIDPIIRGQRCQSCHRLFSDEQTYWVVKTKCCSGVGIHNLCDWCKGILQHDGSIDVIKEIQYPVHIKQL